jgi:hypothetical protein
VCLSAVSWVLGSLLSATCGRVQEFTTVQDNARDALQGIVELFSSQCKELLLSSCSASLKGFLEANGFGGSSFKTLQAMRTESARSVASDIPVDDGEESTKVCCLWFCFGRPSHLRHWWDTSRLRMRSAPLCVASVVAWHDSSV